MQWLERLSDDCLQLERDRGLRPRSVQEFGRYWVLTTIMGRARIKSTHLYLHPSMRLLRQAVNDHLASEVLATIIETNPAMMPIHRHRSREGPAAA